MDLVGGRFPARRRNHCLDHPFDRRFLALGRRHSSVRGHIDRSDPYFSRISRRGFLRLLGRGVAWEEA